MIRGETNTSSSQREVRVNEGSSYQASNVFVGSKITGKAFKLQKERPKLLCGWIEGSDKTTLWYPTTFQLLADLHRFFFLFFFSIVFINIPIFIIMIIFIMTITIIVITIIIIIIIFQLCFYSFAVVWLLLMLKCFSFGCSFVCFSFLFFMIYQWDQNMEYSFKKQVAAAATEYCARAQVQCYPKQSRWMFLFLYVCKARMNSEKIYQKTIEF